MTRGKQ